MSNVLIVAEQQNGKLRRASLSAVTFGKKAAELTGGKMLVLVAGKDTAAAAQELATFGGAGVAEVIAVNDPALEPYLAEAWAPLIARIAKEKGATIVAATATALGKDLAPRLAHLLDAAVASDIVGVVAKNVFRRMVYAGNLIAEVEVTTPTIVVTCRQTDFDAAAPGGAAAPVTQVAAGALETLGSKVEGFEKTASARPELTEARVVVSGGRGMKAGENFRHLEELTDLLGGAMGASRAAVDAGMVPNDLQVGQTGKVVAPELYIAVAISGAIQHLAGMKGSKVIVAINKDENAPIFQVADYGLIADWQQALPELTAEVKKLKAAG